MKRYWLEDKEEAFKKAVENNLLFVRGYDGVTDMDYVAACTKEEYEKEKEWTDGSAYRGWIVIKDNFLQKPLD